MSVWGILEFLEIGRILTEYFVIYFRPDLTLSTLFGNSSYFSLEPSYILWDRVLAVLTVRHNSYGSRFLWLNLYYLLCCIFYFWCDRSFRFGSSMFKIFSILFSLNFSSVYFVLLNFILFWVVLSLNISSLFDLFSPSARYYGR